MLSLSSLTHLSAIVCCRITHPTAAIVLGTAAGALGRFCASQPHQIQSTWHGFSQLRNGIPTINRAFSLSAVEGPFSIQSMDHDSDSAGSVVIDTIAVMGNITAIAIRAIGVLTNGLSIRETFEYLLTPGFKTNSGENSDPRQPKSGRYRLSPLPA